LFSLVYLAYGCIQVASPVTSSFVLIVADCVLIVADIVSIIELNEGASAYAMTTRSRVIAVGRVIAIVCFISAIFAYFFWNDPENPFSQTLIWGVGGWAALFVVPYGVGWAWEKGMVPLWHKTESGVPRVTNALRVTFWIVV
jgi:hypothetical protein